jgi:hypothetical protein
MKFLVYSLYTAQVEKLRLSLERVTNKELFGWRLARHARCDTFRFQKLLIWSKRLIDYSFRHSSFLNCHRQLNLNSLAVYSAIWPSYHNGYCTHVLGSSSHMFRLKLMNLVSLTWRRPVHGSVRKLTSTTKPIIPKIPHFNYTCRKRKALLNI